MGRKNLEKLEPMLDEMMPQTMENIGHEKFEKQVPTMMDTCFYQMNKERRGFMLTYCRGMMDKKEEKCLSAEAA